MFTTSHGHGPLLLLTRSVDRSPNVHAQIPEVSLKFRVSPILALILLTAFWPFGVAYGVVGSIFGVGYKRTKEVTAAAIESDIQ